EVDVAGVEPMTSVTPMAMKMREDVVTDGEIADDVVRNAPATENHKPMGRAMTTIWRKSIAAMLLATLWGSSAAFGQSRPSVIAPGAKLTKAGDGYQFTEGPTPDSQGGVFFTDVRACRIYRWSTDGQISLFRADTGNANGLAFDKTGNLLACEGGRGRVVSIDPRGHLTVVADRYDGKPFNQPNDLWIGPKGGIYFSDPIYARVEKSQDGEHVYYVAPDSKRIARVIDDMVRPNGLVGTPDGRTLFVTDHGAKRTFAYAIGEDGRLSRKRVFALVGADGMKLDDEANLYLAENGILVYDSAGRRRETIEIPEQPTNLCFAGPDGRTLFITARPAIYTLRMRVAGANFHQQEPRP
ncbi:MAG: SMP-30/gluconolactonase/LRE family protein, partial [Pirellulales bacterium]|nr:SMP-30/gluconolactonase/LRE family protein [Pirellulales bacterium]